MQDLLWIIVLSPLTSAFILAVFGAYMQKKAVGALACASVGLSFISAVSVLVIHPDLHDAVTTTAFPWISTDSLVVQMGLRLDALSAVMMVVVSFVALLIHLYSTEYMWDEEGYSRFFAYMNLFVASMLILVLSDNLLLLYLGWEGVGVCSYLLIGFWYKELKNGYAAQKAFIVTRIGDTALAIALFILFWNLGTLNIQEILSKSPSIWAAGSATVTLIAILIIGGAVGKSGQIPLHTWLPDAMAGPTPVSALIHAATMVTAGVYLIARLNPLFQLAPVAQMLVATIGTVTLLYAGFCALAQTDIKRVLAYSTISQIGYMFLALGVGAWTSAIFHLATHAFFKALLFLAAGIAINALNHEQNIYKMGGLKNKLPVAFWTFLIGICSLSALPLVTAGFYSKDAIVYASLVSTSGSIWLWSGAVIGALITAIYSFRLLFLAFIGDKEQEIHHKPGKLVNAVVVILAFFSLTAGFIGMPKVLGGYEPFEHFMESVFVPMQTAAARTDLSYQLISMLAASAAAIIGILIAYMYFKKQRLAWVAEKNPGITSLHSFLHGGMGFDRLYEILFIIPFKAISYSNRKDILDAIPASFAELTAYLHKLLSFTQTGRVRNYATGLALGAVILGTIVLVRHLY